MDEFVASQQLGGEKNATEEGENLQITACLQFNLLNLWTELYDATNSIQRSWY